MRRCHLLKLHLPRVPLLHPNRAEVLVPRRRPLILRRRNAQHHVVGHDPHAVAGRALPSYRKAANSARLPRTGRACPGARYNCPSKATKEKSSVNVRLKNAMSPFFAASTKLILRPHQRLLQRSQRLGRSIRLGPAGNRATDQHCENHATTFHSRLPNSSCPSEERNDEESAVLSPPPRQLHPARMLPANFARGTETCSPVARFFNENASAFTSFSPTIKMYFAPPSSPSQTSSSAESSRSPNSTTKPSRRKSPASRSAFRFIPSPTGAT